MSRKQLLMCDECGQEIDANQKHAFVAFIVQPTVQVSWAAKPPQPQIDLHLCHKCMDEAPECMAEFYRSNLV